MITNIRDLSKKLEKVLEEQHRLSLILDIGFRDNFITPTSLLLLSTHVNELSHLKDRIDKRTEWSDTIKLYLRKDSPMSKSITAYTLPLSMSVKEYDEISYFSDTPYYNYEKYSCELKFSSINDFTRFYFSLSDKFDLIY